MATKTADLGQTLMKQKWLWEKWGLLHKDILQELPGTWEIYDRVLVLNFLNPLAGSSVRTLSGGLLHIMSGLLSCKVRLITSWVRRETAKCYCTLKICFFLGHMGNYTKCSDFRRVFNDFSAHELCCYHSFLDFLEWFDTSRSDPIG